MGWAELLRIARVRRRPPAESAPPRLRVPRFSDTPMLETVLVDRKNLPSAEPEMPDRRARARDRECDLFGNRCPPAVHASRAGRMQG